MTNSLEVTYKTPLARMMFEHDIDLREGARLFKTNRSSLSRISRGEQEPSGVTREIIVALLLGQVTVPQLRQGEAPGSKRNKSPKGADVLSCARTSSGRVVHPAPEASS